MKRQYSSHNAAINPSKSKQARHQHSTNTFSSSDQSANVNLSDSSGIAIGDNATVNNHYHGHSERSTGGIIIEPRELQDKLRHQARICSHEIQPPPIQRERPIVPVSLQIAKEPVRFPDVLHAEGHLHQRKNIVKFYEQSPGDISEEQMFDLPKQQAQQEAERNYFEREADKTEYIKKHGNILAVIGWPGIGKTTSMIKWINQIRKGELVPGVKYVFFIFVRHIDFSKKMTVFQFLLSTIIPDWDHSTESDKAWLKELLSDPNVLIALEGIDESAAEDLTMRAPKLNLYDTADPLDIMLNLVGGKLLPLARIVISSRPDQLFHLHLEHRPRCIVQILGLNKDARDELGHQIWGDRYKLAKVTLDDNPDTFAYCFVPVNFLLTVDYLIHEGKADSVCMTKVLASACKRYAVSDHSKGKECKLNELFKFAWNGYKKMQIVFEEADFEKANIDKKTVNSFLNRSVVQSADIEMKILDGEKRSSFSHLIWQEFMAAVHLLHYSIDDFDKLLQHIHKDRWEAIAKFLFGLCNKDVFVKVTNFKGSCSEDQWLDKRDKLKEVAIRRMKSLTGQLTAHHHPISSQAPLAGTHQFQESSSTKFQPYPLQHVTLTHHLQQLAAKSLHDDDHLQQRETESDEDSLNFSEEDPSDDDSKWKTLLQVCSWIHEANDETFAQDVVAHLPDHIKFPRNTTILPSDVSNVFYALRSSPKSQTLNVYDCNFTGDSLKLFSKEVSSSNIKIQSFCLHWKKLNDGDFTSVVEISQHVEKLRLVRCGITSCQVSSLAEKFSETGHKIQWLDLRDNKFNDQGLVNLVLCLKNIQKLQLWDCGITSAGCAKFAEKFIETGHKLELLNLGGNELIGDDGARSLIPCLHLIEELWLMGCKVTKAVEEEIRSKLKRLGLPENRVYFGW